MKPARYTGSARRAALTVTGRSIRARLLAAMLLAAPVCAPAADAVTDEPVRRLPASDIGAACLERDSMVSAEICYAFIIGVVQSEWRVAGGDRRSGFCLPDDLTHGGAVAAVRKRFRRQPERADQPADVFVLEALRAAFPCP